MLFLITEKYIDSTDVCEAAINGPDTFWANEIVLLTLK